MRTLMLALALFSSSSAFAQPADWRSLTKEQLNNLPKEQLANIPVFEFLAKVDSESSKGKMEAIVAVAMSRLLYAMDTPVYPFGPYIEAATRELHPQ